MDANAFVSSWLAEDGPLAAARARSTEMGLSTVTPAAGSLLRFLATAVDAKTVVETGTGTGVSGLWLVAGMRPEGTLTSIDADPEHQRLARSAFREAGIPAARTRLISGDPGEVLPRLADHAYDLVVLNAGPLELGGQFEQAWRLLRPGGVVVLTGMLKSGRGPDPSARDADAVAAREFFEGIRGAEDLRPSLLPLGDGLLLASAPR